MKIFTFFVFLAFSIFTRAEIYRIVDENGNVVYTDIKPKGSDSEPVKLKPITPIRKVPVTNMAKPASKPTNKSGKSGYYSEFKIVEPVNEATIRNKQSFPVQVSVQPEMPADHKVRLLLDGQVVETKGGTNFSLEQVERGKHIITVELLDGKGDVINSANNTVYVHRAIMPPKPAHLPAHLPARPPAHLPARPPAHLPTRPPAHLPADRGR